MACLTQTPGVTMVRNVRLCSDCRGKDWPTIDVDAPMEMKVESADERWRDVRELRETMDQVAVIKPDMKEHMRKMLRISLLQALDFSGRTNTPLPSDVQQVVQSEFGEPPYPTMLDLMLEDPEFRQQYESQMKK